MLIPNKHSGYQAGIRLYPGGKGGGYQPPPPDPRLVQAQIDSMGVQSQAIQQMMNNSNQMLPTQLAQMALGLKSSQTAYDQAQEDRGFMLSRRGMLEGRQNQSNQDAIEFNNPARREQLMRQAMADTQSAAANTQAMSNRAMERRGGNPYGGAALSMRNALDMNNTLAQTSAAMKTREAARQEGFQLNDRASNALAGYPAMGMQATSAGAGFGNMGLGSVNSALQGMNSGFTAAGGMAGQMGQNATSMYGTQLNAATQAGIAANNNSSGMFGSLLGAGATLGAAYMGMPR